VDWSGSRFVLESTVEYLRLESNNCDLLTYGTIFREYIKYVPLFSCIVRVKKGA